MILSRLMCATGKELKMTRISFGFCLTIIILSLTNIKTKQNYYPPPKKKKKKKERKKTAAIGSGVYIAICAGKTGKGPKAFKKQLTKG